MVSIPLGTTSFVRSVAGDPPITLENRFFEQSPTNQVDQVSLISRPGFRKWLTISGSPIDTIYCQPGSFNDSLFVASAGALYRVDTNETVVGLSSSIFNSSFGTKGRVTVKMAATASIGGTPEYLWIADGKYLWLYAASSCARGTSTLTTVVSGDTVKYGSKYYRFTSGSVSGTPDGSSGTPYLVAMGGSLVSAATNLRNAINDSGAKGVDYSSSVVENTDLTAFNNGTAVLTLYSKAFGAAGNSVATVTVSGTGAITQSAGTLTGGGNPGVSQVVVPDDVGALDVAFIAGYIIVVAGEGYGVNGRFFWVQPGSVVIDPLDFATAERSPDPLYGVKTIEDQFWLFGTNTTEIWYPTGDFTTPFQRLQGKLFNRGIWPGTDVKVKDAILLVDTDGVVFSIQGQPKRISTSSQEEAIRMAISSQRLTSVSIRAWTFSQDGHDFYLLYLPGQTTLVYDVSTDQWSVWKSNSLSYLNQHTGINWTSANSVTYGHGQQSNVVAGDVRSGVLWLIDSTANADQNITTGAQEAFTCRVVGGLTKRGRENVSCGTLYLAASRGNPSVTGAGFTLRTSDDEGRSYVAYDPVVVTPGDYTQEFMWRGLGTIQPPGRIFEISDAGASIRIDGLDMNS